MLEKHDGISLVQSLLVQFGFYQFWAFGTGSLACERKKTISAVWENMIRVAWPTKLIFALQTVIG